MRQSRKVVAGQLDLVLAVLHYGIYFQVLMVTVAIGTWNKIIQR